MFIEENIPLKPYTTFKIGGPAKFFAVLKNFNDLEVAIDFIEKNKIDFFILGGGSNLLIKDEGFDGIVLKPQFDYVNFFEDGIVNVGCSKSMPELVFEACNLGYKGLEWAGGLPGTCGGAIVNNAGCFGFEIKDILLEVSAINLITKEFRIFKNKDCNFGYRDSFFKNHPEWLLIEAKLKLEPGNDKSELLKIMQEKIEYRKERHPLKYPNAGSVFKNLLVENLKEDIVEIAKQDNVIKANKIPAAYFIEKAGLKGKKIGGAQISEKHANFIINLGNAKAIDVLNLIDLIKEEVKNKFDVNLELEIEVV
jgi:UDP-N-acetylmuramate dehydrogenase